MTWQDPEHTETHREPFTVLLAAGSATPIVERPDRGDIGRPTGHGRDLEPQPTRTWLWESTVSSLLHVVFTRGGTVATMLDNELLPFVWGIAQQYAPTVAAEHGKSPTEPAVYALTTSIDELTEDDDEDAKGRIHPDRNRGTETYAAAFVATGLVRVRFLDANTREIPGPGPHFGVVLRTDDTTEADRQLLSMTDRITVVRWWDESPFESPGPETQELTLEGDAPPLQFLIEGMVDSWTGRGHRPLN